MNVFKLLLYLKGLLTETHGGYSVYVLFTGLSDLLRNKC